MIEHLFEIRHWRVRGRSVNLSVMRSVPGGSDRVTVLAISTVAWVDYPVATAPGTDSIADIESAQAKA